jgi:hypothetical protein
MFATALGIVRTRSLAGGAFAGVAPLLASRALAVRLAASSPRAPSPSSPPSSSAAAKVRDRGEHSDDDDDNDKDREDEATKKLPATQRLQAFVRKYGPLAGAFHVGVSLASTASIYVMLRMGVDLQSLFGLSTAGGSTATLAAAFAVNKVIMPARVALTIFAVPRMHRALVRRGIAFPGHGGASKPGDGLRAE